MKCVDISGFCIPKRRLLILPKVLRILYMHRVYNIIDRWCGFNV